MTDHSCVSLKVEMRESQFWVCCLFYLLDICQFEIFENAVVALSGASLATALVKEALVKLYFNPHIWIFTPLSVHRELYVSLIKYFNNDGSLLRSVCGLPRVLDMLRHFYWDKPKRKALGTKPLLHPVTKAVIGERPNRSGISELRQLVLVLSAGVLRYWKNSVICWIIVLRLQ